MPGLPIITNLGDCANWDLTVAPYIHQLKLLPSAILEAGFTSELRQVYLSTNPLVTAFALSLFLAPIFLLASEINKNYSQVDRLWSMLPTFYVTHYVTWAHMNELPTGRLDHVLAFSIVWSLRLTFNYWRRGGYAIGSEDYRWQIIQGYVGPTIFFLFDVVFIAFAQNVLLFLVTTPVYTFVVASRLNGAQMSFSDNVFSRTLLTLILVTFIADQQQWNYHHAKRSYQSTAKVPKGYKRDDLDRGFNTTGLWRWSRHPNFAAEQSIWVVLYLWSCYDTGSFINWTGIGAASYLMLFQASTWLTELISASKYTEYLEYQVRVSRFIPKVSTVWTGPVVATDPLESEKVQKVFRGD